MTGVQTCAIPISSNINLGNNNTLNETNKKGESLNGQAVGEQKSNTDNSEKEKSGNKEKTEIAVSQNLENEDAVSLKEEERKMNEVYQVFGALDRLLALELAEGELYKQTKRYLASLARSCDENSQDLCNYLNGMLSSLGFIDEPLPAHLIWDKIEEIC